MGTRIIGKFCWSADWRAYRNHICRPRPLQAKQSQFRIHEMHCYFGDFATAVTIKHRVPAAIHPRLTVALRKQDSSPAICSCFSLHRSLTSSLLAEPESDRAVHINRFCP